MNNHLKNTDHSYIRYANCWEDPEVLAKGLKIDSTSRILSIASAGDNSFYLLKDNPEFIVMADLNLPQLYLCQLKQAAIRLFEHQEFLSFIGVLPSQKRMIQLKLVLEELSSEAKDFWHRHHHNIQEGLVHSGKFEQYFALFRKKILPLTQSKKSVNNLLSPKDSTEQEVFYTKKWNNWRWELLFKVFFSKPIMGKYGRDKRFMQEVEIPVGTFIYTQTAAHFKNPQCQQNPFLHYILKGNFKPTTSGYLDQQYYDKIRQNIDRITFHHGPIQTAQLRDKKFNRFNLSNIFEYMDQGTFKETILSLSKIAANDSRMVYWNLMVPREVQLVDPRWVPQKTLEGQLKSIDKGWFYKSLHIHQLQSCK